MNGAGRALLLLCVLLLAACAGHRGTRPAAAAAGGGHPGRGGESAPGTTGSASTFHDDISKPQSRRYRNNQDSVPGGPPPDLSKLAEPVPKPEPRALYGNKSPYTVRGRTYRVLPSAHGYVARGIASFYGNKFDGYKTSSLETYDMYGFSAAHKTLPLPSYARVTNLENGKSVVVRINDRGPFHANRLIDLSYAAAVKIGIWPKGTGLVEVRALDPAHPEAAPPPVAIVAGRTLPAPASTAATALPQELQAGPTVPVAGARPAIYLQVGAFADLANAERVAQRLRVANFAPVRVIDVQVDGRDVRRVRVGPLSDVKRADEVTRRIENMGLPRPQVAVD